MNACDVQSLLSAISVTLVAVRDSPLFDAVTDDGSYYTMGDLNIGDDVIDPLGQIISGIDCMNNRENYSDFLTQDLQSSIAALGNLCFEILRADRAARPSEDKATAQEAARQDGHDISGWV
jgi:hypothetical protein